MTDHVPAPRRPLRTAGIVLVVVVCLFFVVRAAAEPFTLGDYHDSWGGPSLAGVLAVHMLPGVVGLIILVRMVRRRRAGTAST